MSFITPDRYRIFDSANIKCGASHSLLFNQACQAVEKARPLARSLSADQPRPGCSFPSGVLLGEARSISYYVQVDANIHRWIFPGCTHKLRHMVQVFEEGQVCRENRSGRPGVSGRFTCASFHVDIVHPCLHLDACHLAGSSAGVPSS